ncbi:Integral membrane protein OS=Streptomyces alboniger OX=132473 GN=CP975_16925 PE=4 SV=1 [Streptomyces alboniger]
MPSVVSVSGVEVGAQAARSRALAVLRLRSRALAVALLPAAVAVVLIAGDATGHMGGRSWDIVRWVVTALALLVLLAAAAVALVVARARPALSPTVPVPEESAPDLYRLVRDLADRLDVPAPSAIALTPDCDSWLEDRTHPAHGSPAKGKNSSGGTSDVSGTSGTSDVSGTSDGARAPLRPSFTAPVLVIGSPFLWWMRVGELRAVLAPVVAGTGPSAHPDIAAARRFVRGLDAAVADASAPGRSPLIRPLLAGVGWVARLLLRNCRVHAAEMERGVAAAAAERAQTVDYGVRIVAQEQVGLAYAGWDRLLTRVALPAWRMGRWPSRLDAGVVAALTELSRRDRLAEGFASRLGERPACDLLEEPGTVDEATSLLAARLFHGGPAEPGPGWAPVAWQEYPDEVVDRKWRTDAARLHRVLDSLGVGHSADPGASGPEGPTLGRVLTHLTAGAGAPGTLRPTGEAEADGEASVAGSEASLTGSGVPRPAAEAPVNAPATAPEAAAASALPDAPHDAPNGASEDEDAPDEGPRGVLAASLTAELAREEAAAPPHPAPAGQGPDEALWVDGALPLFPLQPPRTGRELLADHVTAMVCCAAVDTAGAAPGLDWLDGPALLVDGERAADLAPACGAWWSTATPHRCATRYPLGVRPEKPVRLA